MSYLRQPKFAFLTSLVIGLVGLSIVAGILSSPAQEVRYANRVMVTTTTTGTGALTQLAASTGYLAPTAADDGKTFRVMIRNSDSSQWEVCSSVYTHAGTTWSRGTLESSSTGSRIDFGSGTKYISVEATAKDFARIGNFIDVANFATGGDGSSANPWTGWDTAITWSGKEYRFRDGDVYAYATSPNFLVAGISIVGEGGGAILKHTGSGNAFVMDAGATWISAARVENLIIQGNAATTNGLYLNGVRFCQFNNIRIRGCSAAGLRSERCVTNTAINFTCSYIESGGAFVVRPTNGVLLTNGTTTWNFINVVVEGVSGDGITLPTTIGAASFQNVFTGGTCEVCGGFGVKTDVANGSNSFIGMDFEQNSGVRSSGWGVGDNSGDIKDASTNYWFNCSSGGFAEINTKAAVYSCSFRDVKNFDAGLFINCFHTGAAVYAPNTRRINCRDVNLLVDPDATFAVGFNWNQYSPASGGTHTPDSQTYPGQRILLPAGNITIGAPTGGSVMFQRLMLQIVQDSVGGRTITWNTAFDGTVPQPTAAANSTTMYEFAYSTVSSKWYLLSSH